MKIYYRYRGFTLAEVLITLGIIGIVAALTIPNVTAHYRKKVVETRLAKFYSVMNQAVQMSEKDNGPKEYWDAIGDNFVTDEDGEVDKTQSAAMSWYNKYLKEYLKVTEVKVNKVAGNLMLYFPDGSLCLFHGKSFQFWPDAKDFVEYGTSDSGAIVNNIKLSGIKYFTFFFAPWDDDMASNKYHYKKGFEPYKRSWDGTIEMLKNNSSIGCKETVSNERAYCSALIQQNGWKIPDDYPLKL